MTHNLWETLDADNDVLQTAEGWLVRSRVFAGTSNGWRTNITYVPDPDHIGFGPEAEEHAEQREGFHADGYAYYPERSLDDIPF